MTTRGVFDDAQLGLALANNLGPSLQVFPLAAGIAKVPLTLTPAAVAPNTTVEQNFTLAGAITTDAVSVTPPTLTAGVVLANERIVGTGTLGLQFVNATAGTLTPPAGVYIVTILR